MSVTQHSPNPAGPLQRLKRLFGAVSAGHELAAARRVAAGAGREACLGRGARGFVDPKSRAGTRRIVVNVDDATFAAITARAATAGVSVSEQVRRLVAAGLRRKTDTKTEGA